ncbi:uncharacterized protein EV422DRAFT_502978 [Fimicolochytrium jonesii]|uniref:uncharacterized protein n=1 Tax=Fimicolochytrium jonesii TaxID=1396493 RepID=UPI0022FEFE97|nr:uncharacterized protein EV422DRAFT_502978 [Fimicolochytrium jonesii]KAI8825571.1 hypothetical protein EV422DRAFT_502978 [Fimicolochytrium jonesii]
MASHLAERAGDLNFPFGIEELRSYAFRQPPPASLGSASKWGPNHLSAFHVVTKANLPVEAVVPLHLIPSRDLVRAGRQSLFALDGDVVCAEDVERLPDDQVIKTALRSESYWFYRQLQAAVDEYGTDTIPSASTTALVEEDEVEEDEVEEDEVAENEVDHFAGTLLRFFLLLVTELGPTVVRDNKPYGIELWPLSIQMGVSFHGGSEVRNEESLLVGLRYVTSRLFAGCLAIAVKNREKAPGDQEAFVIGIHRREAYIVHTFFPATYLDAIQTSVNLPSDVHVLLKRSRTFDLLWSDQRLDFACAVLAMQNHMATTDNLVGRMRFETLRAPEARDHVSYGPVSYGPVSYPRSTRRPPRDFRATALELDHRFSSAQRTLSEPRRE